MNFLEKNLEDIIFETDDRFLNERGLCISGKKFRQVHLGAYGIADIITFQRPFYDPEKKIHYQPIIDIFELKKDLVTEATFFQCLRYAKALKHFFSDKGFDDRNFYDFDNQYLCFEPKINLNLIGSSINLKDYCAFLPDIFDNVFIYTYDYKADGIYFECNKTYFLNLNC